MLNVILFSLIGGLFSLLGASFLFRSSKSAKRLSHYATPFAAGVLLGAAFADLLPEAIHTNNSESLVLSVGLLGLLSFFILERYLRWFHHHHEDEAKNKSTNSLVIIGDTVHNALDGVAIGAAFLISVPTGIIASIAVALHEIPQEIGDFGILLKNGMRRKKVLLINALSALATTTTAVVTYLLGEQIDERFISYVLAITAGFFIYIAASDIIPEIHETAKPRSRDIRPWLLILGAVLIMFTSPIAHEYIDSEHESGHSELDKHENENNHEDTHDVHGR